MLLWVRKKYRAVRVGRAKLWMKAHIWLGFLCLPLIVLHSGFRWWDGSLAGVLMFAFLGVIVSGVWGLVLQQYLPKLMFENVPAETIRSQIDDVLDSLLEESGRIVRMTCGRDEPRGRRPRRRGPSREKSFLVIGAVRESGPVQGKFLQTGQVRRVPGSEPLLAFFEETVAPYLRAKNGRGSPPGLGEAPRGALPERPEPARPGRARRRRTCSKTSATSAGSSTSRPGSTPGSTAGSASTSRSRSRCSS